MAFLKNGQLLLKSFSFLFFLNHFYLFLNYILLVAITVNLIYLGFTYRGVSTLLMCMG